MAVTINASTTAGLVQTADTSGVLQLQTNSGTTAVTIDTSQNVGIGTASPSSQLTINNGTNGTVDIGPTASGAARIYSDSTGSFFGSYNNIPMIFRTNNTERMRINSASVGIGSTLTTSGLTVGYVGSNGWNINTISTTTAGVGAIVFTNPNGVVGSINTSGSTTGYATSSDYRLKEDIVPMVGALDTVTQLKPVTYKWKVDGSDSQGFIAHELAEVVPQCVTGAKDATIEEEYEITPAVKNELGNIITPAVMGTRTVPAYQGIDTSFLVATLTAAIQELKQIVDTQAAEIAELKAK